MAVDGKASESQPVITVVTVVYNDVDGISSTIESVLRQDYPNIYYVIIDGGSDDGTLDIIKSHQKNIDHWVSEPDKGISDAFNKGIFFSRNDSYVVFLNSGDEFFNNSTVSSVASHLNNDVDVFSARVVAENEKIIPPFKVLQESRDYKKLMVAHQGLFVKKHVFLFEGGFDTDIKIRMDFDFLFRTIGKYRWLYIEDPVVKYGLDGISSSQIECFWKEGFSVAKKNNATILVKAELLSRFFVKKITSFR